MNLKETVYQIYKETPDITNEALYARFPGVNKRTLRNRLSEYRNGVIPKFTGQSSRRQGEAVTIFGVEYPSMRQAGLAFGCGYPRLERMVGEGMTEEQVRAELSVDYTAAPAQQPTEKFVKRRDNDAIDIMDRLTPVVDVLEHLADCVKLGVIPSLKAEHRDFVRALNSQVTTLVLLHSQIAKELGYEHD